MIRKASIAVLTLGALGMGTLSVLSFLGVDWKFGQERARDSRYLVVRTGAGSFDIHYQSPYSTWWPEFDFNGRHAQFSTRYVLHKAGYVEKDGLDLSIWRYGGIFTAAVAVLLFVYPCTAFARGPLRRWRRRRMGWCLKCGYDLTGNESGTCPECGTERRA